MPRVSRLLVLGSGLALILLLWPRSASRRVPTAPNSLSEGPAAVAASPAGAPGLAAHGIGGAGADSWADRASEASRDSVRARSEEPPAPPAEEPWIEPEPLPSSLPPEARPRPLAITPPDEVWQQLEEDGAVAY